MSDWIEHGYVLRVGDEGKASWDAGTAVPIIEALIFHQLGFRVGVRTSTLIDAHPQWVIYAGCDVKYLTEDQIKRLDEFMLGPNNCVLGHFPPRLIDPPITFRRIAVAELNPNLIRGEMDARGLSRGLLMTVGDNYEFWADKALTPEGKKAFAELWQSLLKDAETGRPM